MAGSVPKFYAHMEQNVPRQNALTRMRRSFFASSGELGVSYHIEFPQVVDHLWQIRCRHGRIPLKHIVFIDDLIHVTGCLSGNLKAWADLHERYERPLIRQCLSRIEESEAIVFVRRFLRKLQQRTLEGTTYELDEFIGDRPLQAWLGELISDALTGGVAVHRTQQTSLRWPHRKTTNQMFALAYAKDDIPTLQFPMSN